MESVIAQCWRWRSLHAYCHGDLMFPLAHAITNNPPMLVEVYMDMTHGDGMNMAGALCSMHYPSSPNLDSIVVQGGPRLRIWDTRLQRTSLTTFIYNPVFVVAEEPTLSLDHVYDLLTFCPALEVFSASVFSNVPFQSRPQGSQREHLVLPNLVGLRISAYQPVHSSEVDTGPLVDFLTTPNLEIFVLMGSAIRQEDGWNHVSDFLRRSNPPITDLGMVGTPITSESLVHCLELLPDVNDLEFSGNIFDDYVVSRLCWNPDLSVGVGENVAPSLFSLKVVGCSSRYVAVESVVLMVQSRCIVPELIGEDNLVEARTLWRLHHFPAEMLHRIELEKPITWNIAADPKMCQEIARNPLIRSYMELAGLELTVELEE